MKDLFEKAFYKFANYKLLPSNYCRLIFVVFYSCSEIAPINVVDIINLQSRAL